MYNYFNGKGTIGFTCDSCGRELNGCSIVNGMKFCAKCYQETFGKDNQQNEIQQLKQQLAEKYKEIDEKMMSFEKRCQEYYKSDECKKDFAIQELEKVNSILTDTIIEVTQDEFDLNKLCYLEEISAKFYDNMQNQIKKLKGE